MDLKLYNGPIMETQEEAIGIGMNSEGSMTSTFLRDICSQYPPVLRLFRRWIEREEVVPGDFQTVPGLSSEGAMIRPTIISLVVCANSTDKAKDADVEKALRAAWTECQALGFHHMALHAPSIFPHSQDPSRNLQRVIAKMDSLFFNPFVVYES